MHQEYKILGPIKYRKSPVIRKTLASVPYPPLWIWQDTDPKSTQIPSRGAGYPVWGIDNSVVNFVKIRTINPAVSEESFIIGHPIAQGRVVFGDKTAEVLIAVDCRTALTLHLATGFGTVAVLYHENLITICKHLKDRHTETIFKVCVNDEGQDEHSPTLGLACEAAAVFGTKVITSGLTSFQDIYRREGSDGIFLKINNPRLVQSFWGHRGEYKELKIARPANPWPHQIDGACMLTNLISVIRHHVIIPEHMALIVSLWIIHTYVLDTSRFSPLLAIISSEYGTGKATLLAILKRLSHSAYRTSKISHNDLLKLISEHSPTMLFDQGDSMLRSQQFVEFFDSSHDRTSGGITAPGKKDRLEAKGTYIAKAIKAHIALPESLIRRSIQIQLQRRRPDETILPVNSDHPDLNDELTVLVAQIARWSQDHGTELKETVAAPLDLINEHFNNTFSPLLAIAQVIGADVLHRTEAAARALLTHVEIKSEGVQLLENLKEVLQEERGTQISSADLVDALCSRSDWRWATCNRGKRLDFAQLAKMLKEFKVCPRYMRIGGKPMRGYDLNDFQDPFSRYIPDTDAVREEQKET